MIVWLDLETTGLLPTKETILEVALIITDDDLKEICRWQRVTSDARHWNFHDMDPFVQEMHHKNGLWMESLRANPILGTLARIDEDLSALVQGVCAGKVGEKNGPQIAGNTIGFDRAFCKQHLPTFEGLLHYRSLDVTSVNELARRTWTKVYEGRPRTAAGTEHRAMADVLNSLDSARYYRGALEPVGASADRAIDLTQEARQVLAGLAAHAAHPNRTAIGSLGDLVSRAERLLAGVGPAAELPRSGAV